MTPLAIAVDEVTKRFAGHTAVDRLSLDVPEGVVYGLLGPNGAGKTTTIRMIMRILLPDEGRIALFGLDATRDLSHLLGYLPEERGLYRRMRVHDLLMFLAEARGVRRHVARYQVDKWLVRMELDGWRQRRVDELSKGMQQKLQFISTVLHDPRLVVLDEAFAGLDPVNVSALKETLLELKARGTTILFSTHVMEQAEKLCDFVCIVVHGTKVADGPLALVKRGHGGRHAVVALAGSIADQRVLRDPAFVARLDDYGTYAEIELAAGAEPSGLLARLVQEGARINRFEVAEPTLHKVFVDLVERGSTAREQPNVEA